MPNRFIIEPSRLDRAKQSFSVIVGALRGTVAKKNCASRLMIKG